MAESDRLLSDCTPYKVYRGFKSRSLRHCYITRPWLSWIERQTTNLDVVGSNPTGRANKNKGLSIYG